MLKHSLFSFLIISFFSYCNNQSSEKSKKEEHSYLLGTWKQTVTLKLETEEERQKREQEEFDRPLVDNHEDNYIVFEKKGEKIIVYRRSTIEDENELGEQLEINDDDVSFLINGFVKTVDKYHLEHLDNKLKGKLSWSGGEVSDVILTKMKDNFDIPHKERRY